MTNINENQSELIAETDCFNIVREMILVHGIDVVYPSLIGLRCKMNRNDEYGEPERLSVKELSDLSNELDWQDRQDSIESVMEAIDNLKKDAYLDDYKKLVKAIEQELWEFVETKSTTYP